MARSPSVLSAGLLEACDSEQLFGVELTARQRELLAAVEAGGLLHVWALGRRSGKTLMGALVGLWTCLLRPELAEHVRRRERIYSVAVGTNLQQSRIFVALARSIVEPSPLLAPLVESVSEDELRFRNRTVLAAFPCTSRGGRGWPIACLLMDEAAHMLDGEGNAAAGSVFTSLSPSVAQFGADARVLAASSPFGVDGWFADTFRTVEAGELPGASAVQAGTLASIRKALSLAGAKRRRDLDRIVEAHLARDPEATLDVLCKVARRQRSEVSSARRRVREVQNLGSGLVLPTISGTYEPPTFERGGTPHPACASRCAPTHTQALAADASTRSPCAGRSPPHRGSGSAPEGRRR